MTSKPGEIGEDFEGGKLRTHVAKLGVWRRFDTRASRGRKPTWRMRRGRGDGEKRHAETFGLRITWDPIREGKSAI